MTTERHIFADSYSITDEDGNTLWRIYCNYCHALSINGVPTHETGCQMAWRDKLRECRECDTSFYPEERDQKFCSESCRDDFYGVGPADPTWFCRGCGQDETEVSPCEEDPAFCSYRCKLEYGC